jgi:hypothetical protein
LVFLGLKEVREYSDGHVAVRDSRRAKEKLMAEGHIGGTVVREAPSDGRSQRYNGFSIRGTVFSSRSAVGEAGAETGVGGVCCIRAVL